MAKKLVIVVGQEKVVDVLGMGAFPIFLEVVEFGRPAVIQVLEGTYPPPPDEPSRCRSFP